MGPIPSVRPRNLTVALMVILVSGVVILAGVAAVFLVRPPSQPIPPSSGDGIDLFVDSVTTLSTLGGQQPARGYWLEVDVTLRGSTQLTLTYRDWEVQDAVGVVSEHPDSHWYGSQWIYPSEYITYWLRFDLYSHQRPDRVILTLPGGHGLGAPLSGGPQAIGIYVTRSNDGMNWTLDVVSRPSGLTTAGTTLTLLTAAGGVALPSKALSNLSYARDRVAYESQGNGFQLSVGDRLSASTAAYPAGYQYRIANGTVVLASGTFSSY